MTKPFQGHLTAGIPGFPQRHGTHSQAGDPSRSTVENPLVVGRSGASENELSFLRCLIYFVAHRIPEKRHLMPLVNEPGYLPFQHQCRRQFCQLAVLKITGRIADIDFALAVVGRGPGLAAPLWPLYTDGTKGRQVFFHLSVDNTWFVHCSHLNNSVRLLQFIQSDFSIPFSRIFKIARLKSVVMVQNVTIANRRKSYTAV